MLPFIPEVIEQHADDAVSLFMLRERAVSRVSTTLAELTTLDTRLNANLEGLCLTGEAGWHLCNNLFSQEGAAGRFAGAVVILASGNEVRLRELCRVAADDPLTMPPLLAALSWLPLSKTKSLFAKLIWKDELLQQLVCVAHIVHGVDPGDALVRALQAPFPSLKETLLRGVGELGRTDLTPLLQPEMSSSDDTSRFWAAWSTMLLVGAAEAKGALRTFARMPGPFQSDAVAALARSTCEDQVSLADGTDQSSASGRLIALAAKARGRIDAIPLLIEQMASSAHARFAADAFTHITGAAMESLNTSGNIPLDFQPTLTEDPSDIRVALDPDDGLPWPDVEAVKGWWKRNEVTFNAETRYLRGRPMKEDWLQSVLRHGRQGERWVAALEWAAGQPGRHIFNTRAPGFQQTFLLSMHTSGNNLDQGKVYLRQLLST